MWTLRPWSQAAAVAVSTSSGNQAQPPLKLWLFSIHSTPGLPPGISTRVVSSSGEMTPNSAAKVRGAMPAVRKNGSRPTIWDLSWQKMVSPGSVWTSSARPLPMLPVGTKRAASIPDFLRRQGLQAVHGRIFAESVVADLGRLHGGTHFSRRPRRRLTSQINNSFRHPLSFSQRPLDDTPGATYTPRHSKEAISQ